MGERIIRIKQVMDKIGLGRTKVYQMVESGDLPKPVRLGPRAVGFLESEIDEWIDARVAERDGKKDKRG